MVYGIGTDIVEIARIHAIYEKTGQRFIDRILTSKERDIFFQRSTKNAARGLSFLASRFAAKEAFAKALGSGIGKKIGFQSLAILNHTQGAPAFYFFGDLAQEMCDKKLSAKVSIADEIHYAVAQVLILQN